jgi:hypothetical protein
MSLKNLQEIASLVTDLTRKNRLVEWVDEEESDPKYARLIKGLGTNRWQSEQEACDDLYGKELGSKTFDMLKSRAKDQLVNLIFQLDTNKQFKSSYDRAYFNASRSIFSGAILFVRNKLKSGEDQLKLGLKISRTFNFTDFEIISLKLLRSIASFSGSEKQFNFYNSSLKKAIKRLEADLQAEELNQELILDVVKAVNLKQGWIDRVKSNYSQLVSLHKEYPTHTITINMYRVGIRYFDGIGDYHNAIRLATECEDYLNQNPHLIQKVRLGEMNLHKLYGALHLRDYINGSQYAETCTRLFNAGTLNWLIFLEYYFLLALHTNNVEKALEIHEQVITHPAFKNYPPQNKEKWKIFEAFLAYLQPKQRNVRKGFNVARFMNEVPIFSKDKAGYNLSIIVAQILLSLKTGDYSRVMDRAEPLKLYASRHIRKEKNPRSYYFIKMLLVMIKYDFDPLKSEQIARKFYIKLKSLQSGGVSEIETLEVIPYDVLWPQILEILKNKNLSPADDV